MHAHSGGMLASRRLSQCSPAPFGTGVFRVLARARLSVMSIAPMPCVLVFLQVVTYFRGHVVDSIVKSHN